MYFSCYPALAHKLGGSSTGNLVPEDPALQAGESRDRGTIRLLPPRFALCGCQEAQQGGVAEDPSLGSVPTQCGVPDPGAGLSPPRNPEPPFILKQGSESPALPCSQPKWHCCVFLAFVIFRKRDKSAWYMHSYSGHYFETQ